jgi:ribonuclease HII
VKGDARCYAIACASIIAKVLRDDLMRRLSVRYPAYGWDRNCGYATLEHITMLDSIGATPHHRTSFRNRDQLELLFEEEFAETVVA